MKFQSLRNHFLRRFLPPHIILLISILTTMFATYYVYTTVEENDRLRFENEIQETEENIDKRLDAYVAILRGTAGLLAASEFVTKDEFHLFVNRLRLNENYPGIQGLGFAPRVIPGEWEPHLAMLQEANPSFQIHPNGARYEYYPIVYLEPENKRNQAALGFDMFSEETRRAAMIQARDTAKRASSGKVTLIQEIGPEKQAGFLIYMPVYHGGVIPETVEERRDQILGFVYAPFRTDDLLKGIFGDINQNLVNYKIYDGTEVSSDNILHESISDQVAHPRFAQTTQMDVAGRIWTIVFSTKSIFEDGSNWNFVPYTLILGSVLSFLFYYISRSQAQAFAQAEQASERLSHSQERLKQSEYRYRIVVENTNDLIALLDNTGKFTYVNPSYKKILGYSPKVLEGKRYEEIIHPADLIMARENFEKVLKGKVAKVTLRLRNTKGKFLTVEGAGLSIYDKRNQVKAVVTTAQDITEREELEKRKDEFISIASHELKTPVTSLKAFTQVARGLIEKNEIKKASNFLSKMDEQINKLTRLINELLNLSRIQQGKLELNLEDFEVDGLVKDTAESMQAIIKTHKIILEGKSRKKIKGDKDRVGQILINLITNAAKYSPDGEKIIVRTTSLGNDVQISVQDFGIGLSKEHLGKIFERFYQVSDVSSGTYPGLGIGLYICAEIARRHKGKLWVKSKKGEGSTFSLKLPALKS